jgi:hypothetical protein|tara:strand:- start:1650 stop:1859 length:210 start_codon:yes stop_codon:yes gene_type:complete
MMNILMYPFLAFVALGLYLWHFKNANIQISFITGVMLGGSITTSEDDEFKTNYLDFYLGIVIITFVWDV